MGGLSATLTHVYGTDRHWQSTNIIYTINQRCLAVYAAYASGPTTKLAIYNPFEIHAGKTNEWCKNHHNDGLPKIHIYHESSEAIRLDMMVWARAIFPSSTELFLELDNKGLDN